MASPARSWWPNVPDGKTSGVGANGRPPSPTRRSRNCARARGGAWATNDNPYEIGTRVEWCTDATIPGPMRINNSNEYGHLFYSFHPDGALFAFADGAVRFYSESTSLRRVGGAGDTQRGRAG